MATGTELFSGMLEDNRQTDQAWVETTLINYHDDGNISKRLNLQPGKESIQQVSWMTLHKAISPSTGQHPMIIEVFCVCSLIAKFLTINSLSNITIVFLLCQLSKYQSLSPKYSLP